MRVQMADCLGQLGQPVEDGLPIRPQLAQGSQFFRGKVGGK